MTIPGLAVGHWTDLEHATGCTAILLPTGSTGGVSVPGRAPATRETDVLRPSPRKRDVHAIVLSGGSAYGLDAAGGVMRVLEKRGIGHPTPAGIVPIVPTACIFDLGVGSSERRPGVEEGAAAAEAASEGERQEGLIGAATGASCGKYAGFEYATKTGFGAAHISSDGIQAEAFAVCNAVGDIVDEDGQMLAGSRAPNALEVRRMLIEAGDDVEAILALQGDQTTIACVVTDAILDAPTCNQLAADVAAAGFGSALAPPGTVWDGDALFLCSTNQREAEAEVVRAVAATALATAIRRCASTGEPLAGLPSAG